MLARTVEFWFKADTTSGVRTIYEQGGNSNGFYVGINGGNLRFTTQNNDTGPRRVDEPFTDTTNWHHVAAVFDNGTMRLYLDGAEVGTLAAGFSTISLHSGEPGIARTDSQDADDNSGPMAYFDGSLDEIAIYDRVLSATEIADHANDAYLAGSGNTVRITAFDAAAQSTFVEHTFTVVAGPNPTVTITAPADSSSHSTSAIDLTYTATDDVAVTKCELQLDAGPVMEYTACDPTTVSYIHLTEANKFLAYDFAEGDTGPAEDRAADGENNDGTLNGPTATTSPNHGVALEFDGVDDWVSPNAQGSSILHSAKSYWTFETWFKADSTSGSQTIFDEGGLWNGFYVGINSGNLRFSTQNNDGGPQQINVAFTDTTSWHHLVAVFNNGTMLLYLDGGPPLDTKAAGFPTVSSHGSAAGLGATGTNNADDQSTSGFYFDGKLDEVAVYDRALTQAEITAHYNNSYLSAGQHTLKVTAHDADTNTGSDEVTITIQ